MSPALALPTPISPSPVATPTAPEDDPVGNIDYGKRAVIWIRDGVAALGDAIGKLVSNPEVLQEILKLAMASVAFFEMIGRSIGDISKKIYERFDNYDAYIGSTRIFSDVNYFVGGQVVDDLKDLQIGKALFKGLCVFADVLGGAMWLASCGLFKLETIADITGELVVFGVAASSIAILPIVQGAVAAAFVCLGVNAIVQLVRGDDDPVGQWFSLTNSVAVIVHKSLQLACMGHPVSAAVASATSIVSMMWPALKAYKD